MENSYGVGVVNRYALFLEDEADPLDTLRARELDRERRRKHREAEKENKPKQPLDVRPAPKQQQQQPPQQPQQQQQQQSQQQQQQQQAAPARRAPVTVSKEGASPPGPGPGAGPGRQTPRRHNGPAAEPERPRRELPERRDRPEHVPGAGGPPRGGPGRGRGRGAHEGRGGKREFDRRSGSDRTGVKPVDKRDGGGSHNWGSHKDDLDDFNKTQAEAEIADPDKAEAPAAPPAENKEAAEEEAPAAPTEEETKEFTLDEWKALKGSRQKPQYNLRKAGEGEDLSQWKDMVVLTKTKADGEDSDDEYESAEFPQRVGRQKRVEGIEFTFYENRRGGGTGGRGGRGGRGGGRGRGGPRPQREERGPINVGEKPQNARQNAPKVNDNKDFPSLG